MQASSAAADEKISNRSSDTKIKSGFNSFMESENYLVCNSNIENILADEVALGNVLQLECRYLLTWLEGYLYC